MAGVSSVTSTVQVADVVAPASSVTSTVNSCEPTALAAGVQERRPVVDRWLRQWAIA